MKKATFESIYGVVKQIPYGKVATYGQVAALAGSKRWARVVGYALHANPDPENIPCYRVVNRFGEVSRDLVSMIPNLLTIRINDIILSLGYQ